MGFLKSDRPEARDQRPEARDQRPEARDQRPETRGQRPEARGQRPETRGQRPETRGQRPVLYSLAAAQEKEKSLRKAVSPYAHRIGATKKCRDETTIPIRT